MKLWRARITKNEFEHNLPISCAKPLRILISFKDLFEVGLGTFQYPFVIPVVKPLLHACMYHVENTRGRADSILMT